MKQIKKQLGEVEKEIIAGKKLVREKQRALRKAGTFVEQDNKARAFTTAVRGVEGLEDYREALEDTEVKKSSGRRGSKNERHGSGRKRRRAKPASR
jgi:hypothetical protein